MPTTKTKTYAAAVAAANSEAVEQADAMRQRIEDATQKLPELETAALIAEDAPDDVRAAWRKGDLGVPALALSEAQGEAVKAREVYAGAKARLSTLNRQSPNTDTRAADVVKGFLSNHALPGIPVHVASVQVDDKPRRAELPVLLVVQSGAAEQKADGYLSGVVELVYWNLPAIHKTLSAEQIEDAAGRAGMGVRVTERPGPDGEQRLRVNLIYGYTNVPKITDRQSFHSLVNGLASSLAAIQNTGSVQRVTGERADGNRIIGFKGSRFDVAILADPAVTTSTRDGVREDAVKVHLGFDQSDRFSDDPSGLLADLAADYRGLLAAGCGLVVGVKVDPKPSESHRWGYAVTFTLRSTA